MHITRRFLRIVIVLHGKLRVNVKEQGLTFKNQYCTGIIVKLLHYVHRST